MSSFILNFWTIRLQKLISYGAYIQTPNLFFHSQSNKHNNSASILPYHTTGLAEEIFFAFKQYLLTWQLQVPWGVIIHPNPLETWQFFKSHKYSVTNPCHMELSIICRMGEEQQADRGIGDDGWMEEIPQKMDWNTYLLWQIGTA